MSGNNPHVHQTIAKTLMSAVMALALSACGGGEQESTSSGESASRTGSGAGQQESRVATVRWNGEELQFTGRFCFLTESGGSQGGVDVSGWTSSNGDELTLDWAGDSPTYSMASIKMADGREFHAVAPRVGEAPLEVRISGSTATIQANLRDPRVSDATLTPSTIEVRCP